MTEIETPDGLATVYQIMITADGVVGQGTSPDPIEGDQP